MADRNIMIRIRLILATLAATAILLPRLFQPFMVRLWASLRSTPVYQWSTFETIWTVFCYAAIEVSLTVVFMKHPNLRLIPPPPSEGGKPQGVAHHRKQPRGMRRPSRRLMEALVYIFPLLAMDLTLVKKFADVPLSSMLESANYYANPATFKTTTDLPPKTFLVPTFHNFSMTSPLQTRRALPLEAPSSTRLVTELATSIFIFDFLFFALHVSLHYLPFLHSIHAPHHHHDAQLNPQVTNQLSIQERLSLVLLANFSLNIIGAHVLTRTIFVPVFIWLLVEIHSGMDLPWGLEKILPYGWAGGAKKHMRHHRHGVGDFEPFFSWWDDGLLWLQRRRAHFDNRGE